MNPNPVAFQLFGQPIYWYGILISMGVLLGILLAMRNAKVFDVEQDSIIDFALLAIPLAIVGARLYYVIFEWDLYRENLLDIFNIRKGGLAIYGGDWGDCGRWDCRCIDFCQVEKAGLLEFGRYLRSQFDPWAGNWKMGQLFKSGSLWSHRGKPRMAMVSSRCVYRRKAAMAYGYLFL